MRIFERLRERGRTTALELELCKVIAGDIERINDTLPASPTQIAAAAQPTSNLSSNRAA